MPLTKSQIAQRKNSKNRPKNLSTGQFEKKNKASDSSNSDFILSDEIYSSDSDVDIIHIDAEVAIKQGKRNNPENKIGIPRTTKYRKYGPSGEFTKAAKNTKKIEQFFKKSGNKDKLINIDEISNNEKDMNESDEFSDDINNKEIGDLEKDNNIANEINDGILDIDVNINHSDLDNFGSSSGEENLGLINKTNLDKLENILKNKKLPASEYFQYLAIYKYFVNLNKDLGKMEASNNAAKEVYNKDNKGSYKGTCIRKWAMYWLKNGALPKTMQGCHQKTKSLIDDEDVINGSLEFIRQNGGKTMPLEYKNFVNSKLLAEMEILGNKKSISDNTSHVWLRKLGLVPQSKKKGIYYDGHEREDVVAYRKIFLERMKEFEQYMPKFVGDEMIQINPELPNGQKLYIFIAHDESLFYSNDDRPTMWAPLGEPPLRKKGQGKSIMVSEFLLETIGCLKLTPEQELANPNIPKEARKFLKPGKNEEGWWTAEHLLDQVINYAIPIFETIHPGTIAVFAFDNSTNHGSLPKDGLNAAHMNAKPGGKQPCMRSTFYGLNNTPQEMVFPANHPTHPNLPKGMCQILKERGLWSDGLVADCKLCKGKNTKVVDLKKVDCCMRHIISL